MIVWPYMKRCIFHVPGASNGSPMDNPTLPRGLHWAPIGSARYFSVDKKNPVSPNLWLRPPGHLSPLAAQALPEASSRDVPVRVAAGTSMLLDVQQTLGSTRLGPLTDQCCITSRIREPPVVYCIRLYSGHSLGFFYSESGHSLGGPLVQVTRPEHQHNTNI